MKLSLYFLFSIIWGSESYRLKIKMFSNNFCINNFAKINSDQLDIAIGDVIGYKRIQFDNSSEIFEIGICNQRNKLTILKERDVIDKDQIIFHENEDLPDVDFKELKSFYRFQNVIWTQRIVEDRISNPHGEHAEDVWIVNLNDFTISP